MRWLILYMKCVTLNSLYLQTLRFSTHTTAIVAYCYVCSSHNTTPSSSSVHVHSEALLPVENLKEAQFKIMVLSSAWAKPLHG